MKPRECPTPAQSRRCSGYGRCVAAGACLDFAASLKELQCQCVEASLCTFSRRVRGKVGVRGGSEMAAVGNATPHVSAPAVRRKTPANKPRKCTYSAKPGKAAESRWAGCRVFCSISVAQVINTTNPPSDVYSAEPLMPQLLVHCRNDVFLKLVFRLAARRGCHLAHAHHVRCAAFLRSN